MSEKRSDWYIPGEALGLLGGFFLLPTIIVMAFVISLLTAHEPRFPSVGLVASVSGIVLLFFARLPLYRKRQFGAFGPRDLDRLHRCLYWLAYLLVAVSITFLVLV